MDDLISVVIPVYNSEKYIKACLRSVLSQTYRNLEVLVIDDGSTDHSGEICEGICRTDGRVRCIHQANQGVSAARNTGIENASGEYIFLVDSDDLIHKNLMKAAHDALTAENVEIFFTAFVRFTDEEEQEITQRDEGTEVGAKSYAVLENDVLLRDFLAGNRLGLAVMISRKLIGGCRYDTGFSYGEDTLFVYDLISRGTKAAVGARQWYYYRDHEGEATNSTGLNRHLDPLLCYQRIREREYAKKGEGNVVLATSAYMFRLWTNYLIAREKKDKELMRKMRDVFRKEEKNPFFKRLPARRRFLMKAGFCFYPLYPFWNAVFLHCDVIKREMDKAHIRGGTDWQQLIKKKRILMKIKRLIARIRHPLRSIKELIYECLKIVGFVGKDTGKIGILTFHCADNYGALLQAYGLKTYLENEGQKAEIVNYSPPFMTGRHWFLPYYPKNSGVPNKTLRRWRMLRAYENMAMGKAFFRQRKTMRKFRKNYLTDRKIKSWFVWQLWFSDCGTWVVGSDQIWNPEITFGLRRAYFGDFHARNKRKVISYGASLGGGSLDAEYEEEFSRLLQNVDAVSLREAAAVPFVEKCGKGKRASVVCDPVFLLPKESWEKLAVRRREESYIFLYATENRADLYGFARRLSEEKGLKIIEVKLRRGTEHPGVLVDDTAGPSEFLGYVRYADYVVTNSFHALAFSIIFQKQFVLFPYGDKDARLYGLLKAHGLESRLYGDGRAFSIDEEICWDAVQGCTEKMAQDSVNFLTKNTMWTF